ncbi:MAG: D-alanyl-D-alanine carboxypeptidase [Ruminiclostridium sp.]|nr:D-alanyl-D-alanine carboxypeptidase [Ruminiclostridium sp.]
MDGESGRILFSHNANEPRAIASITKLMTALVAAEHLNGDLSQTVTIRPNWTGIEGTSLYLKPGEELTCQTLLYGLLLHSGNDAAVALAEICAGDTEIFVDWMNQRAADLGMTGTHFSDPNGLGDENHCSTALDMARLGRACLENDTVAPILATRSITLEGRSFTNHNKLLWQYPGCTGMKTGYTRQAGRTLVSSAERDGQTLICVTLNDGSDWADHTALLDYGFEVWSRQELVRAGDTLGQVRVEGSLLRQVPVTARETLGYPLREGEEVALEIRLPESVQAPVTKGEIAGSVTYWLGDRQVGQTYLVWGASAGRDVISRDSHHTPLGFLKRMAGE